MIGGDAATGTGAAAFVKASMLLEYGGLAFFSSDAELNRFCNAVARGMVTYIQNAATVVGTCPAGVVAGAVT
jgi:hypothetical protein